MRWTIDKVIGRDHERKSRFHTRRGRFGVTGFVTALTTRAGVRQAQDAPWIAPGAVARLDELLNPSMTVLELGSGASSAWYAARCASLLSIEPEQQWYEKTREQLRRYPHAEVRHTTIKGALDDIGEWDVIIVDHHDLPSHSRLDSLAIASRHARLVVLDDSDRPAYANADDHMTPWPLERFVGFRSRPLVPTETSIWHHPSESPNIGPADPTRR